MTLDFEIQHILKSLSELRTPEQIIQSFGNTYLNFDSLKQLVQVFDPNIQTNELRRYFSTILTKYNNKQGITQEIYKKILEEEIHQPKIFHSLPLLKQILDGFNKRKIPLKRVYDFFDDNGNQELEDPEFRELLEFFYVYITDDEFKQLRQEFQGKLSYNDIEKLFDEWKKIVDESGQNAPDVSHLTHLTIEQIEEEKFQNFLNIDYKIPGVKELANLFHQYEATQELYTDQQFPPNQQSLGEKYVDHEWQRLNEYYNGKQKVFAVDSEEEQSGTSLARWISHKDIVQGNSGASYLLATIGSMASQWPSQIQDLYPIQRANKFGIYGVKLCVNGEWKVVIVDDNIPLHNGKISFTATNNAEIWVTLLEKAWAKLHGSYQAIETGDPRQVIQAITGGPVWKFNNNSENFKDQFFNLVDEGCVLIANTSDQQNQNNGLKSNESYSVLQVIRLENGVQLIKLRNPDTKEEWNGDWSDSSNLWTPQIKQQVGFQENNDDGIFYISFNDFTHNFKQIYGGYFKGDYYHNSIKVLTKKSKAQYFQLDIKTEGEYFFTIHQEILSYVRHSQLKQEYSSVRLLLARVTQDGFEYIDSKHEKEFSVHIGNVGNLLQPGKYILYVKIKSHNTQKNQEQEFVLSAYGEQFVTIKQIPRDPDFLTLVSKQLANKEEKADQILPDIFMKINKIPHFGMGYITFINKGHLQTNFETIISKQNGCKLSKPEKEFSFKSYIPPQGERIVIFTQHNDHNIPELNHHLF